MKTYEQWNKAIISYFFEDREPEEVVFLQVTSDTLPEIAKHADFDIENAEESLAEAVKKKVAPYDMVRLLAINPSNKPEEMLEQDPPQVAFLALCVLAASKMDSKGAVAPNDYYIRLNQLLFGQLIKNAPQGFDKPYFEYLWKDLQNWVDNKYNVKLYLTQGHPKYVWYPISQCPISKYDEHKLHAIFKEVNLKPGSYLAGKQLFDILSPKKSFQNLSVKITRPFVKEKTAEIRLILRHIQLLLKTWDGEVQDKIRFGKSEKRRSPSIDVQLKFNPFMSEDIDQIYYWFRCRQSTQLTFKPNVLNVKSLQSDDGKWFDPLAVDAEISSLQMLQNGFEIKSEETKSQTYRLIPSDIWVFRNESEPADGWFSQGNLFLHELHRIVFPKEKSRRVTSILEYVCEPFNSPKSICISGEEIDWQYVEAKPNVLAKSAILGYRITTSEQISFIGGLPLDRRSNTYFDFCLPTIVVPDLVTDSDKMFYINGQALKVPIDRKIELPEELETGEYQLSYLDCNSTLHIISPTHLTEHEKHTFAIHIDINSKNLPSFKDYKISEMSEESVVWLSGAKFFGENNISLSIESNEDTSVLSAAELISSVVKVAIELKQGNISPPEWLNKAIHDLNQDIALRALVKKKLYDYQEIALSYHDLCCLGGD